MRLKLIEIAPPRHCLECGAVIAPRLSLKRHERRKFCSSEHCTAYNRRLFPGRFWEKVDRTGECWLWLGCKNPAGYGIVNVMDHARLAHRVAWELMHGPIPKGKSVLHDCPGGDNPACVRHLWLGTHLDNARDAIRKGTFVYHKGRGGFGERHGSAKLTEAIVLDIRARYAAGGILYREIAAELGVDPITVGDAIRRRTWKHVP